MDICKIHSKMLPFAELNFDDIFCIITFNTRYSFRSRPRYSLSKTVSLWQAAVSSKYLEYQQSGYIDKLRKIYFPPSRVCVSLSDTEGVQLKVANAAGTLCLQWLLAMHHYGTDIISMM